MKLFGEYLIEKEIISDEVLVQALIEQMKSLPSTAEVVFEKSLLSAEQLLALFRLQLTTKCGFIEAATTLDFWSDEIETVVEDHLATVRIPLGQILIKMGSAKLEQITHALDDFFAEVEKPEPEPTPSEVEEPADLDIPSVSEAETMNESSPVQMSGISAHYCDLFTPDLRTKLDSLFSNETGILVDPEEIGQIKEEIHRLKGAARLVAATESEKLLASLEQALATLLGVDLSTMSPELSSRLKTQYEKIVGLVWQAQLELQLSDSEGDAAKLVEFKAADDQVQLLCFDLGFA